MRLISAAFLALCAVASIGAVAACGARDGLDDDGPLLDAGNGLDGTARDAKKPPTPDAAPDTLYIPQAARCVRDGGAPVAFLPDPDAGAADAAHPRAPQVVSAGGPSVTLPTLVPVTFPGDDLQGEVEDFIASIGCTDYWRVVASDYGVGQAVTGTPIHLTESAPSSIDDNAIQTWLAAKVAGDPAFPQPDANTVFVLFYPAGTRITLEGAASCQSFGAYHNSAHVGSNQVPYATIPRCGFFNNLTGIDAVTAVTSHELLEAVTDPIPNKAPAYSMPEPDGWGFALVGGGEVGDLCEFKSDAFFQPGGYPFHVQRTWSNRSAFGFQDPCEPALATPFFAAAPRFTTTINVDIGAGSQQAQGITVAMGQQATVDIVAFATGAVPSWQIQAYDSIQLKGGTPELALSLDKANVQDGDVAHLKITRKKNPQQGASAFGIVSSNGSRQAYWWGLVN